MTETPTMAASGGSYFARHWRGELSLPRSYWLNGVAVGIVSRLVFTALLTGGVAAMGDTAGFALFFLAVTAANVAILVWVVVGIWRAAGRYAGPKYWAILARVAVAIGVIGDVLIELNNFADLAALMSPGG